MTLRNTNHRQDTILGKCEDFGGPAEECAQIAAMLDEKLEEAKAKIEELERSVEALESELRELR